MEFEEIVVEIGELYRKVIDSIKRIQETGYNKISLSMLESSYTEDHISEFYKLCDVLKVKPVVRIFSPTGRGKNNRDELLPNQKREKNEETNILSVQKGVKGVPGGIEGVIIYNPKNYLGVIEENTDIGIYGKVENISSFLNEKVVVPVAKKKQIELGKATIYCTVKDRTEPFEVEIEQIDYFPREENKSMVLRITDERLLEKTGGIVQGMSGSPIIQDGKLAARSITIRPQA